MLDRQHPCIALGQGGREPRVGDRTGRHRDFDRVGQIHPAKHNARVGGRGAQRQLDPLAAVQAHAHGAGHGFQGALLEHAPILILSAHARTASVGLLAQERRDFEVIHATG